MLKNKELPQETQQRTSSPLPTIVAHTNCYLMDNIPMYSCIPFIDFSLCKFQLHIGVTMLTVDHNYIIVEEAYTSRLVGICVLEKLLQYHNLTNNLTRL